MCLFILFWKRALDNNAQFLHSGWHWLLRVGHYLVHVAEGDNYFVFPEIFGRDYFELGACDGSHG